MDLPSSQIGLSKDEILELCSESGNITPALIAEIIDRNNARIFEHLDPKLKGIVNAIENLEQH